VGCLRLNLRSTLINRNTLDWWNEDPIASDRDSHLNPGALFAGVH
jgi:hypothetical protein